MAKPYDVSTKLLLRRDPSSWMAYLHLDADGPIEAIDADLSTVPAEADLVYRVGGPGAHLVHVEAQGHWDGRLPRRLWRYNAMLDLKYDLRVRSVVLLLRPEANSKALNGFLDLRLPDEDRIATFHYRVVRAWEQPVGPILTGPLATLPMAPLADVPTRDVPRVLERIDARLIAEAPRSEAVTMMAAALALAGMRRNFNALETLRGRLRTMDLLKESPLWQYVSEQAGIQTAREILIDLGRDRFGRLPKATRAAIEAIDDLKRIKHLTRRVLTATGWNDLLREDS